MLSNFFVEYRVGIRGVVLAILVVVILISNVVVAYDYTPDEQDQAFMERIDAAIVSFSQNHNKERLVPLFVTIEQHWQAADHPRIAYVLEYALKGIQEELRASYGVEVSWDKSFSHEFPDLIQESASMEEDMGTQSQAQAQALSGAGGSGEQALADIPYTDESLSMQEFRQMYGLYLTKDEPILEQCIRYYDQIDELAQEHNFPTALIIAMWYREHTCWLDNPANGWGNFQITSHYYEPGEIDRDEFATQVVNFIEFSRAKRAWYDNLHTFDDLPVRLGYDTVDLLSLRKHAILYNGLYSGTTPENSTYANQNFGRDPDGRDGIVATFLKVLEWKYQN